MVGGTLHETKVTNDTSQIDVTRRKSRVTGHTSQFMSSVTRHASMMQSLAKHQHTFSCDMGDTPCPQDAHIITHRHKSSHVTRRMSHVTRHTSHVTRHTSHVTRHTSHVTRHHAPLMHTSTKIKLAPTGKEDAGEGGHLEVGGWTRAE